MAEHALRGALTNAIYEELGSAHRVLFEEAKAADSSAHGPELATLVLARLTPELAHQARGNPQFFRRWVEHRGGELPRTGKREAFRDFVVEQIAGAKEVDRVEKEDLRWVGLAVLVAVVGAAFVALTRRTSTSAPLEPLRPVPSMVRPIRFAIAGFSRRIRDAGTGPTAASGLLTEAAYWWVGTRDGWERVADASALLPIDRLPESDDALLVVVFEEASGDTTSLPSSRPEGASRLRGAASVGDLRWVGTYAVRDPRQLVPSGFQR